MRCENCNAEIASDVSVCPVCGSAVSGGSENPARNIEGFENTVAIQQKLKKMLELEGEEFVTSPAKFIALLNDYMPQYEKERRLLKNMLNANMINDMLREPNQQIAIMKAEKFITDEMYLSKSAAEFVMVCFTSVLGWDYEPSHLEELKKPKTEAAETKETKTERIDANAKVFKKLDGAKYRMRGNVVIPEGYTRIDSFCFDGFGFLKTVELPKGLVAIGEYSFSECKRLKEIDFPPTVKIIKHGAFNKCAKLTMVKVPDGVLEIEDSTFQFCTSLEIVEIPPTVSSIGTMAFAGCEGLRKLYLPDSIKFIDDNAFAYCPNLTIRCYENSYIHKYCLVNNIKVEPISRGAVFKF